VRGSRKGKKVKGNTKSENQGKANIKKDRPNPTEFFPKPGLVQCKHCSRSFAADRIDKHLNICKKMVKKRKPFDVSKARVDGTDAAKFRGQKTRTKKVM
jgi:hypothetical protein